MQNHLGVFIVLEGADGSGKGTQFRLLAERLKAVGHEVAVFDFPRYDEPSSYFVKRYLNGSYGPAGEVSPYTASIFYALDRYETASQINKALAGGKVLLANRYVGSNMAHQGTKFTSLAEQRGFFMWADSLEYQLLGIPRPSLNLYLKVPPEISYELISQKAGRSYTAKKRDEHEADIEHIKKAGAAYELLCKLFPKDFKEIICTKNGQILSIIEINDLIWGTIKPLLPAPKRPGKGAILNLDGVLNQKPKTKKNRPEKTTDKPSKAVKVPKQSETALANEHKKVIGQIKKLRGEMLNSAIIDKNIDRGDLNFALQSTLPLSERPALAAKINQGKATATKAKTGKADEPRAMQMIINELVQEHLPNVPADNNAQLIERVPHNEFELLGKNIGNLTYREKQQKLNEKFNKAASNYLGQVIYRFDIVADLRTLDLLLKQGAVSDFSLEGLGPRYGYNVPEIIKGAGLEDQYNKCFKLSSDLYGQLISRRHVKLAAASLLLGHRGRWKVSLSAAAVQSLRRDGKCSEFINMLIEKIAESHPLTAQEINEAT